MKICQFIAPSEDQIRPNKKIELFSLEQQIGTILSTLTKKMRYLTVSP